MKKKCICICVIMLGLHYGRAQVGMMGDNPDKSAVLDLSNPLNKGLLIPRMALTNTTVAAPVTAPATSLMVYNTATAGDVTPGHYYWDGVRWVRLQDSASAGGSNDWTINGNTNGALKTIGTKDNYDLPFITNDTEKMRLNSAGNLGIGTAAPTAPLTFAEATGRKIAIWTGGSANDHQYIGIGLNTSEFVNQINSNATKFSWRAGTSTTASNNLMTLTGTGNLGLGTTTPGNKLSVNGKVEIVDGTQGVDKVLTSDSNGVASWQIPPGQLLGSAGTLGAGVNINVGESSMIYTGSYVDLPKGKWAVNVTMILSKGASGLITGANESWWLRSTFSDSPNTGQSSDIQGAIYISGLLPPSSWFALLTGSIIINNTTAGNKRYYYNAGRATNSYNNSGYLERFGANSWSENTIIVQAIR